MIRVAANWCRAAVFAAGLTAVAGLTVWLAMWLVFPRDARNFPPPDPKFKVGLSLDEYLQKAYHARPEDTYEDSIPDTAGSTRAGSKPR